MHLRYRFTFIDVEIEDQESRSAERRVKSCPPISSTMPETSDLLEEETNRHLSVKELERKALNADWVKELIPTSSSSSRPTELLAPSIGSYGHPELCRRPCLFLVQNNECLKGASCDFCHAEHRKVSGLDKAQRMVMSRLSHYDKLRMLLPPLRSKVQDGWQEAESVLELLQESCPSALELAELPERPERPGHVLEAVAKVLTRMSLMALLGVLQKYITEEPLAQHLGQAIADLRNGIAAEGYRNLPRND